ncbi:MAG: GGDEF domain-containing protein [Pseudomonadales bacterium]
MTKSNPYSDSSAKAAEFLRLTVSYLAKYAIPHSPLNYRLVYESVSGRNDGLKAALEELLTQPGTPSEISLWKLYQRFFEQDVDALETMRNELRRNITSLQGELTNADGDLCSYAKSLDSFINILDASTLSETVLTEVEKVIEDTRLMKQSQLCLESQITGVLAEVNTLRQELDQVKQESLTDSLTGISNRRAFDAALEHSIQIAREDKTPFCLLIGDIDHFKQFNDTHGHLVGDKVLRFVASILKRCVKGQDTVARLGGEEFAVILPQTHLDGAYAVAEQIRKAISAGRLKNKGSGEVFSTVEISIGVTQFRANDIPNDLIERADQALYRAKDQGRNRVEKAM